MFKKVLIANRGEIAVRVARTLKRLGIRSVAVYSEPDAGALHVRSTDEAWPLGGQRALDSYLNRQALLAAIERSGADAVHPGYGLLSEDPTFAREVRQLGVAFIGPSEQALELFGDKVKARHHAQRQGLTLISGTTEPLTLQDPSEALRVAERIGYPVLVKAAAGGGGIGMQRALRAEELTQAIETCAARSRAAFGDDRVYLERWVTHPRHIEVQILADSQGQARALSDRECSVQRRHQKVIEEAPSPAAVLDSAQRARLYEQAERLIQSAGYVGLATVEFILEPERVEAGLYFLEVNARLQVEHPVTECISGLDLVELQLRLASGESLQPEWSVEAPNGHAIEARLYAEDPARNFAPQPGLLERFELGSADVRLDSGYLAGDTVSPYYDPLIAKLIAHGSDRETARRRLAGGLATLDILLSGPKGPRVTNLGFLQRLLETPDFVSGEYDTQLVERSMMAKP